MIHRKETVVMVDAYSLGASFSKVLTGLGYSCIHVQSRKSLPNKLLTSFFAPAFSRTLCYESMGLQEILKVLRKERVLYVLPGSEPGVGLADLLVHELGVVGNCYELTGARRDKFLMHEAIKSKGVESVDHKASKDCSEILNWVSNAGLEKVVLKPLSGGGGHNVFICANAEEISKAFQTIQNTSNLFNQSNETALAQDYLKGEEYIVNSVSLHGKAFFTDVWVIRKDFVQGHPVCSHADSVSPFSEEWGKLTSYVSQVLDALGISFGAAHCEVMMTSKGPTLIECGARFEGAVDMSAVARQFGSNQFLSMIDSCFYGDNSIERPTRMLTRSPNMMRHVYLQSDTSGMVAFPADFTGLFSLDTFFSLSASIELGDEIEVTTDLFKSPGFAYLYGKPSEVERDYQSFRLLERQMYKNLFR